MIDDKEIEAAAERPSLMSLMALWLGWTNELQKSKQWKANGQK